jgi:hypothetical protein
VKIVQRPLSLILLFLVLLVGGIAIARTRTVRNSHTALTVGCTEDCKEKLDKTLERCNQLPDARRPKCEESANEQYNKCTEKCGERAQ